MILRNTLLVCVTLPVLLLIGCSDEHVAAPPMPDPYELDGNQFSDGSSASRAARFTGRDSIGVALKANISGRRELDPDGRCPDVTVRVTGEGVATHLGRVKAFQSHCLDSSNLLELTDGQFTLLGVNGAEVRGRYEGILNPTQRGFFAVEATMWVEGGHVQATAVGPEEGKASMRGTTDRDGSFSYRMDGWLLHHLRKDSEE